MDLPTVCRKMVEKEALGIRREGWVEGVYLSLVFKNVTLSVTEEIFVPNKLAYIYELTYDDATANDWDVAVE